MYDQKALTFSMCLMMLERAIAKGILSICPSVTLVIIAHTVQNIKILKTAYDGAMLVKPNFVDFCVTLKQRYPQSKEKEITSNPQ